MAAALAAQNLRTVAAPRRASTARPLVRRSSSASSLGRHSPTIEHHHHVKGRVPQMHDGAHGERHDERWERMFRLLHVVAKREAAVGTREAAVAAREASLALKASAYHG